MATKRKPPLKRFMAAIESGDINLVERLIENGANNNRNQYWPQSPAVRAIQCGHIHILALLKKRLISSTRTFRIILLDMRTKSKKHHYGSLAWRCSTPP
jgi:hypothetical protein